MRQLFSAKIEMQMHRSNPRHEAVVTGIGVISSLGQGVESFWRGIKQGRSGIGPLDQFEATLFGFDRAGKIASFDPLEYGSKKGLKRMERVSQILLSCASLAFDDAGLEPNLLEPARVGVVVGSAFSTLKELTRYHEELKSEGPCWLNPGDWPKISPSSPSSRLSIFYGFHGPSLTLSTGAVSGLDALGQAKKWVESGVVDAVLAGGVDELSCERFSVEKNFNYQTSGGCDQKNGKNVFPGEAGAVFLIENEKRAKERGAKIFGKLSGFGAAFKLPFQNFYAAACAAIDSCLSDAQISQEEIGFILAESSAGAKETIDLNSALRNKQGSPPGLSPVASPIVSIDPLVGDCASASGTLRCVVALLTLVEGCLQQSVDINRESGHAFKKDDRSAAASSALALCRDDAGSVSALLMRKG